MAKRDPNKTSRNKIIAKLSNDLRLMLPDVLSETGIKSEGSLNGIYGGKFNDYMDIRTDIINSPEELKTLYLEGLIRESKTRNSARSHLELLKQSHALRRYLSIFLERFYYRYFDALRRNRPDNDDNAQIWIGQNNANWGILITPRFNTTNNQWENDGSEIRYFPELYWTIGHILHTGLVVPGRNRVHRFADVESFLGFLIDVLVRNSGSEYEYLLAQRYCDFVLRQSDQKSVPLLIPEYRYGGISYMHRYRLDFTIINPYTLIKYGFELSPWSTHGYLYKTSSLTQKQINEMARDNFENEMKKHKDFFNRYHVYTRIYTDRDLADLDMIFGQDMLPILSAQPSNVTPDFNLIDKMLQN